MSSSTIKEIQYSPITQELEITFHSGGTYRYKNVPKEAADAFQSADSLGSHFHKHVKPHYPGEKVEKSK